ncbi:hypothetical protein [Halegenticoccus tardaugens]|uniref:hypothetical protein n=1 Tax=Halegenticoccus tardaugens TaxID=2071624 RepID=UPI0013E94CBE|nr:hypothetical protein [Halegenticoccus tardaugens]
MGFTRKGTLGLALMIVGTIAFLPGVSPEASLGLLVLPAAVLLTVGTYLVGTDGVGRPV